jgi:hypothetical protein
MKKYIIAVSLTSSKVLYFNQRAYTRKDAEWIIRNMADVHFGNAVVSVKAIRKEGRDA